MAGSVASGSTGAFCLLPLTLFPLHKIAPPPLESCGVSTVSCQKVETLEDDHWQGMRTGEAWGQWERKTEAPGWRWSLWGKDCTVLSLEADTSIVPGSSVGASADVIHSPVLGQQCLRSQDAAQKVHRSERNVGGRRQQAEPSQG